MARLYNKKALNKLQNPKGGIEGLLDHLKSLKAEYYG